MTVRLMAGLLALGLSAASAAAHHAISAYYDSSRRTTLDGVVTQFQFISPHPIIVIEVGARGETRQWRLEMDNRSELASIGIRADTLKAGDRLVVSGSLARDESPSLYVLNLTRPADGFGYEQVGSSPRITRPRK